MAVVEFKRAIELNPNYRSAHEQFGMALGFQGRSARVATSASCASVFS